jgi:hypothetical protein
MSSEDNSGYPSISAGIEQPSVKAEIRIFLVDPSGRRPPQLWSSDLGRTVEHREMMVAKIRRLIGIWRRRKLSEAISSPPDREARPTPYGHT